MRDMNSIVGTHDIVFITLDTLRWDVADTQLGSGRTPHFGSLLPIGWEPRYTPGSFTYAAHHAFFAGFLPIPVAPGVHPRPFAARFEGSETTTRDTCVFDEPDIVHGLEARGYHTVCIGGVGFFDKRSPLGGVLPGLFAESHWETGFSVAELSSTERQFALAARILDRAPRDQRIFMFINVSAIHQPNHGYMPGATADSPETQAAALAYVDSQLPILLASLRQRPRVFGITCGDHGTAYGEAGWIGHRAPHPVVWTVPYAEFVLDQVAG